MRSNEMKYIFIADSHLADPEDTTYFFSMLDRMCSTLLQMEKSRRPSLVFLGDIFELWIAIPGYEAEFHTCFLSWCRKYKEEFPIYFIEGNHEFFVISRHKKDFSFSSAKYIRDGKMIFLHGDQINLFDWKYRSLRAIIRNRASAWILRLLAGWGGTFLVEKIRKGLKGTNLEHKKYFPAVFMENTAERLLGKEDGYLVAGHFHEKHVLHLKDSSQKICTLPAWDKDLGLIGILFADGHFLTGNWRDLLK